MNKNAIAGRTLTVILASLMLFFILLSVSFKIINSTNNNFYEERKTCRLSAFYLSKTNSEDFKDFKCSTITYTSDKVPEDPDEQKKLIANEMFYCWNVFGEGNFGTIFRNTNAGYSLSFKKGLSADFDFYVAEKCFVCSEIQPPKEGFNIDNFLFFLQNNNPPTRKHSYYEILYGTIPIEKNKFISGKKGDKFRAVYNGLDGYTDPLYVVYSEGKNFNGVGVYTSEEFRNGEVCSGVIFGN